ncbi:MAG TPA: R3H domain-containing nucleic acid-binding protein [Thermoflexales bacterium]|nr:R3H domain-containing nucleic acid-binding protein [Thermoflexales bacterium]HQW34058.1 R3H domain-containing nucleic acid-binding protein [Thermoflexales bacterium]
MTEPKITDDLDALFEVLPPSIVEALRRIGKFSELIEVVMDLGRPPESRYASGEELILRAEEVTRADIDFVLGRIGGFDDDNRAGIARTLHRLSGIKNRHGAVVGLTCRVGRAVYGTLGIIEDIITSGKSILLLGRPGIGKTTMLREAARVLAENRRVVIVDTSNEIGGDGDIPHPAVGRARRMQVSKPSQQHEVMIEAVENHNPQVIVIDEIGRELETEAARTIAERGVQLIGTAHGQTLENLIANPTLNDLVGGIESVTLSDEEARRRGTQKTVLERRADPTFDVLIEIQDRHKLVVHPSVKDAVDSFLRGRMPGTEIRSLDAQGNVSVEKTVPARKPGSPADGASAGEGRWQRGDTSEWRGSRNRSIGAQRADELFGAALADAAPNGNGISEEDEDMLDELKRHRPRTMQLFAFGIARNRLVQAVRNLGVPADVVDSLEDADVLITAKPYYRQRTKVITDAESRNVPIYVLRSNSSAQMENCLIDLFDLSSGATVPFERAIKETEEAIKRVQSGERDVALAPQNAFVRRQQHEMARMSNLVSHSYGKEPNRRVRIFRD